jgi:hypothetical protein
LYRRIPIEKKDYNKSLMVRARWAPENSVDRKFLLISITWLSGVPTFPFPAFQIQVERDCV